MNNRALVRDKAACKDMDTNLFYPQPSHPGRWGYTSNDMIPPQAAAACASCPVREQCLELGLANREQGIWGGVMLSRWNRKRRVAA